MRCCCSFCRPNRRRATRDTIAGMAISRGALLLFFGLLVAGYAAFVSPGNNAFVEGTVTNASGPVAGAIVRWQGGSQCTRTNAEGQFRVAGGRSSTPLTAALPDHPIAVGSARRQHLQLPPMPKEDNDDAAWIDPSPNPERRLQCANCHAQIHDEWAKSAHGNSAKNRKFLRMFAGSDGAPLDPQGRADGGDGPNRPPLAPLGRGAGGEGESTWNLLKEHPLGSGVCAS